jgi:hypothetical protein
MLDARGKLLAGIIYCFFFFVILSFSRVVWVDVFILFYTHIGKTKSNKPNYKRESTGSIPLDPEEKVDAE